MTLLPSDDRNIKGFDAPRYKVPNVCCVPGCNHTKDDNHHLWRRSFLGGDFWWVEIPGFGIIGNIVPLCRKHHRDVTGDVGGHKAQIKWVSSDNRGSFMWIPRYPGLPSYAAELTWQPPRMNPGDLLYDGKDKSGQPISVHVHTPEGPASSPRCSSCGQHLPKPKPKKLDKARRRKNWIILVPQDSEEDGAVILDLLLEQVADFFGHDPRKEKLRYFTVVQALALVIQHKDQLTKGSL